MLPGTARERLELFVRAARFGRDVDVGRACDLVELLVGELPDSDRALLRLAVSVVALKREAIRLAGLEDDLDFREQAILDAVVEYVGRRPR